MKIARRLLFLVTAGFLIGMFTACAQAQCLQGGCGPQKNPYAIQLTWTPPAGTVAGYLVFRLPVFGGTLVQLNPSPITAVTLKDATVSPGAFYLYSVESVDASGNQSAPSNVWMGGTPVVYYQKPRRRAASGVPRVGN
jgi:hypothetical protein